MIRFFSGVAFGWIMARDPPTPHDINSAMLRLLEIINKILPTDLPKV